MTQQNLTQTTQIFKEMLSFDTNHSTVFQNDRAGKHFRIKQLQRSIQLTLQRGGI